MNKKVVGLILSITMLLCSCSFAGELFSDFSLDHWAAFYIYRAQDSGIINGYPDGTFKPENKVKTGEFIKLVVSCRWEPNLEKEWPEGSHWVTPYAKLANNFLIYEPAYTYEMYETNITRADAAILIGKMYRILHPSIEIDTTEKFIKECPDENLVTNEDTRYFINLCMQYGLINGFEDGTLRPNDTLTRAQAAKLVYLVCK